MVIDPKQTFIAYRCPHCGNGVISSVGILSLGGDMLKLKCECGESALTIQKSSTGQIRLSVPCLLCSSQHNFTVSQSIFFGKDMFVLPCPYTDVNICFMGDIKQISAELDRTGLELVEMLGEENVEALMKMNDESDNTFTDPQIHDIVMFVIGELEAEHKISCNCEDGECDVGVEVFDDGIKVYCKKCGAQRVIPTDSLLGAYAFLNCDRLNLE